MSLTSAIKGAARSALNAMGDLKTTCTYTHKDQSGTYDPSTLVSTNSDTTKTGVSVLVTDEVRRRPGDLSPISMSVAYIHADDLTTDPADGDYLTTADGRRWDVVTILANNEIVWELEVTRRV